MAEWRKRWRTFTSFVICGAVVVLGTLLYPLVFLLFSTIALVHPVRRRPASAPPGSRKGAGQKEARR